MKKLIHISLSIFLSSLITSAQCPTVSVTGPAGKVPAGRKATFKATVKDSAASVTPAYKWKANKGSIVTGQGTTEVVVNSTGTNPYDILVVTVTVDGFPFPCIVVGAGSVHIDAHIDAYKVYT